MRFRWDWLKPVMSAPYVPTLGPVHPDVLSADLFDAVVSVAGTRRFLPYDEDQRWSNAKDEHVIVSEIFHGPGLTIIPTLTRRGGGLVKLHHYAHTAPDAGELAETARKLAGRYGVGRCRLVWFSDLPVGARDRLMLKTFTPSDKEDSTRVVQLAGCEAADTFPEFAGQLGVDGFAFLYRRLQAGAQYGPVFVTVEDGRIVGAIGPMGTLIDRAGTAFQLPHCFAVHPNHRGRGHGRALWRAAMNWGQRNGSMYKVLQVSSGTPAEQLYLSEQLATLGFVHQADTLR